MSATAKTYGIGTDSAAWQVVGDEAVVIHTATSAYFSLNRSGTYLWKLLAEGGHRVTDLLERLCNAYGIPEGPETRAQVETFVRTLVEADLVAERADDPGVTDCEPPVGEGVYEAPELTRFGDLGTLILSGE